LPLLLPLQVPPLLTLLLSLLLPLLLALLLAPLLRLAPAAHCHHQALAQPARRRPTQAAAGAQAALRPNNKRLRRRTAAMAGAHRLRPGPVGLH
jgi:hypothetical protein